MQFRQNRKLDSCASLDGRRAQINYNGADAPNSSATAYANTIDEHIVTSSNRDVGPHRTARSNATGSMDPSCTDHGIGLAGFRDHCRSNSNCSEHDDKK